MASDDELENLIRRIPSCCSSTPTLKCCCGRIDCVYLKHNCVALDGLEQEVRTAAQLGQVRIPHSALSMASSGLPVTHSCTVSVERDNVEFHLSSVA
jgi:hypothetical protein